MGYHMEGLKAWSAAYDPTFHEAIGPSELSPKVPTLCNPFFFWQAMLLEVVGRCPPEAPGAEQALGMHSPLPTQSAQHGHSRV